MEENIEMPETPEMPVTQEVKPRHPFYDRIKGMNPDREFADDDEYLSAADEKLTEHEEYRTRNDEANKVIIEALYAEPVLAQVLEDVGKGADLVEALALYISPEDLMEAAKSSNPEKWGEKKAAREANRAAHQSFMDEVNANTAASQKVIQEWSDKRGLDPDAMTEFINEVGAAMSDLFKGKVTPQFLDSMYEAKTKPDDLAAVAETAEIKGRNANIEELTAKENGSKGDGLPAITSMGAQPPAPTPAKPKHELEQIAEYSQKVRGR